MDIKSILVGVSATDCTAIFTFILTDENVISIEYNDSESVGLIGWWPVEGKVLDTVNPTKTFEEIHSSHDYVFLKKIYNSLDELAMDYSPYAETIKKMKIEDGKVILPDLYDYTYGVRHTVFEKIREEQYRTEDEEMLVPSDEEVPF